MTITLRKKKLKNGKVSLYLDYYKDGKRTYEFLKLYVYEKVNDNLKRTHNKETLKLAESIKAKRTLEIQSTSYGFPAGFKSKVSLLEYFQITFNKQKARTGYVTTWKAAYSVLKKYPKGNVMLREVDDVWLNEFKNYLLTHPIRNIGGLLKPNSASGYFNILRVVLNRAFEERIITDNPTRRVKPIRWKDTHREFLTIEELQRMAQTDCESAILKRAFLFSALTGLRWSDVVKLKWREVSYEPTSGWHLRYKQQKTQVIESLPISEEAVKLLGEKNDPDVKPFDGLVYGWPNNDKLSRWVKAAGIEKKITFHCARHTYATIMLTKGVDIYTVSKLLGHAQLKTTQVYAKIIDQSKVDAVKKLPVLNIT